MATINVEVEKSPGINEKSGWVFFAGGLNCRILWNRRGWGLAQSGIARQRRYRYMREAYAYSKYPAGELNMPTVLFVASDL